MLFVGNKIKTPLKKYIFSFNDMTTGEKRWSMLFNKSEKTGNVDKNNKPIYAVSERYEIVVYNVEPIEDSYVTITKILGAGQKTNLGADKKTQYYVTKLYVEIENSIENKEPNVINNNDNNGYNADNNQHVVYNTPSHPGSVTPSQQVNVEIEEDDLPF